MQHPFILLFLFAGVTLLPAADTQPYETNWRENPPSVANVSFLLNAPAGKNGFIRAANGHLVNPDGTRFRMWGMNFTASATLPPKADAPVVAEHLARFAINCVRFHFLDLRAPAGLIAAVDGSSRSLDPAQLDRLDFFIAELKKRGIYADLNLNVGRAYQRDDGVRDYEIVGFAKTLTYFDERLIELQREYARQLLTHRNPYTGAEYRNEPAVALVELVNENSIVESWFSNRLLGKGSSKHPGTWSDIPPSYEKALTEKYHAWLAKQGLPAVPRLRKDEFGRAPKERFEHEAQFYMELERNYFRGMGEFLKTELKVKSLIAGTSDHNHGNSGYPLIDSTSQLDVVDGHVYWQHPNYTRDPETGKTTAFTIKNTPMVNDPLHSTVVELSRSAVAGKPYIVSEVNHPFPAEFGAEGIPILAAYAAFQDWDGIFWYTFEHNQPGMWRPVQKGHFDHQADPVKMAQIAAGAMLFLRGDVQPAKRTILRSYTREQVYESIRLPNAQRPFFTPGFPLASVLRHATRIASLAGAGVNDWKDSGTGALTSDTGELSWLTPANSTGLVVVDTPKSQALIGFVKANRVATANLSAELETTHCAITLSAVDGQPIARSAKLLLTTGSRVENTGMEWNAQRTSLLSWGSAPTRIEPVSGTITLRGLVDRSAVTVTPMFATGSSIGAPINAVKSKAGWSFPIGGKPAVWYAIELR